ncbi:hypothetical protein PENSPDRAFT_504257 [Peniophora sp. CONT]|nr:hypothetical protein PENSPDRAFT_504257 [Peniophora sp. CONT]
MTAARTGRRAGVAPSSSSSAGPSRIQSTNVKTAGLPAQLQAIVNGTPSTGDDIKVYQNRIVRLDARVDQLTGENKQKGQELQDAHARIAELIKENASLKRKADDSDLYQNALKKARRSQRDILPDYKKGTPTGERLQRLRA